MPVELRHLCDFSIDFEPTQYIPTGVGMRANYVIKQGTVTGERFNGELIAGGGDWVVVGPDRRADGQARDLVGADDGELVFVTNTGRIDLRDGIAERLLAGERLGPADFYARSCPLFETGSQRYGWLNSIVTVALNGLAPDHVDYEIYEVA